jgi:hypothetical protein
VVGQAHGSIGEARGGQEWAGDGEKRAAVLAPMEASGEEERRAGEGRLRCGMLQGGEVPFYRGWERGSGGGKGGGISGVIAAVVNGDYGH